VASAVRLVAKAVMTGNSDRILSLSGKGEEILRGQMAGAGELAIGWRPIHEVLERVPGIGQYMIEQQLANLKASGEYATVMHDVGERAGGGGGGQSGGDRRPGVSAVLHVIVTELDFSP
jgi:hypothetical protein